MMRLCKCITQVDNASALLRFARYYVTSRACFGSCISQETHLRISDSHREPQPCQNPFSYTATYATLRSPVLRLPRVRDRAGIGTSEKHTATERCVGGASRTRSGNHPIDEPGELCRRLQHNLCVRMYCALCGGRECLVFSQEHVSHWLMLA